MAAKLLYRDAQGKDAAVDVAPEGVFLGRATDCAVRTEDAMVSRKNCKISSSGGRWIVEDLGSSNGTFVNETRVQKQVLQHADVIRCGSLQVRFVEVADGQPQAQPQPRAAAIDPAQLVAAKDAEIAQLVAQLNEITKQLETLTARTEVDAAELRKARTELVAFREKLNESSRERDSAVEELNAQQRVTEELREEATELKAERDSFKSKFEQLSEEAATRTRLLERAQDDVTRTKQSAEELRLKLTELQRVKDEGWKELNSRVGEIDQLREVISEQERMLEERRVGIIAIESSSQEARSELEQARREAAQLKGERDELRERLARQQKRHEESEDHAQKSKGAVDSSGEEIALLTRQLGEARAELATLEEKQKRLEAEKRTAISEKIDSEAQARKQHDQGVKDKAAVEADLAKMKHAHKEATDRLSVLELTSGSDKLKEAETRIRELEIKLAAQPAAAPAPSAAAPPSGGGDAALKQRVEEVYHGINDILSELRTSVLLAKDLVAEHKPADPAAAQSLTDAVQSSVDKTEDAKGLLRSLREV